MGRGGGVRVVAQAGYVQAFASPDKSVSCWNVAHTQRLFPSSLSVSVYLLLFWSMTKSRLGVGFIIQAGRPEIDAQNSRLK